MKYRLGLTATARVVTFAGIGVYVATSHSRPAQQSEISPQESKTAEVGSRSLQAGDSLCLFVNLLNSGPQDPFCIKSGNAVDDFSAKDRDNGRV